MSRDSRFAEPIVLPDGVKLASLRESIAHLVKTIPAAERRMRLQKLKMPDGHSQLVQSPLPICDLGIEQILIMIVLRIPC